MHSKEKMRRGASLLELILAIAVFMIGSATIAHLYIGAQSAVVYSIDKTQAIFLAKEGVEIARIERNSYPSGFESDYREDVVILDKKEFSRKINIVCSGERCAVESSVEWNTLGRSEDISFLEFFTFWKIAVAPED